MNLFRTIFLYYCIVLCPFTVSAQSWNKLLDTPFPDVAAKVEVLPNGDFWVASNAYRNTRYITTIWQLGSDGSLKKQQSHSFNQYITPAPSALPMPNGSYWISADTKIYRFEETGVRADSITVDMNWHNLALDQNRSGFWGMGKSSTALHFVHFDALGATKGWYSCLCGLGGAILFAKGTASSTAAHPDGSTWLGGTHVLGYVNPQGQIISAKNAAMIIKLDTATKEVWKKVYDFDVDVSSLATQTGTDAVFALFKPSWLVLLNAKGDSIWRKPLTGMIPHKIVAAPDGGVYVAGEQKGGIPQPILLRHYDKNGNLLWEKTYSRPENLAFGDFQILPDGSFILVGSQTGVPNAQIVLFKTDSLGNPADNRLSVSLLAETTCTKAAGSLKPTVLGSTTAPLTYHWSTGDTTPVIQYFRAGTYAVTINDGQGRAGADTISVLDVSVTIPLFEKQFGEQTNGVLSDMIRTSDHGFAITGESTTTLAGFNLTLTKLDSTGAIQWQKALGGSDYDGGYALRQHPDGGFWVLGATRSRDGDVSQPTAGQDLDWWLLRTDAQGNLLWNKTLGGSGDELPAAMLALPSGGLLLGGYTDSEDGLPGTGLGKQDAWLLKTDADGNVIWQKRLGGTGVDLLAAMTLAADGDVVVSLNSDSPDPDLPNLSYENLWIYRINSADGTIRWSVKTGGTNQERSTFVQRLADDRFAIGFRTYSRDFPNLVQQGGGDAALLLLYGDGHTDSILNYGTRNEDLIQAMLPNGSQGYWLVWSENDGVSATNWLLQTDLEGRVLKRAPIPSKPQRNGAAFRLFSDDKNGLWAGTTVLDNKNNLTYVSVQHLSEIFQRADFLKGDTLVCPGTAFSMAPNSGALAGFQQPIWDNGTTSLQRTVAISDRDSIFALTAIAPGGCVSADFQRIKTDKMSFDAKILLHTVCDAANGAAAITIQNQVGKARIRWADGDTLFSKINLKKGATTFMVSDDICEKEGTLYLGVDTSGLPRPNGSLFVWYSASPYSNTYTIPLNDFMFLPNGTYITLAHEYQWAAPAVMFFNISTPSEGWSLSSTDGNYVQVDTFSNGDFLFSFVPNNSTNIRLYRVDQQGNILKNILIPGADYYIYRKFAIAPDGSVYLLSQISQDNKVQVRKLRNDLSSDWTKTYSGSGNEEAIDLAVRPDNNVLILANSNSKDGLPATQHGGIDIWLFLLDPQGNAVWSKSYGGSQTEKPHSLIQVPDGYIIVATTTSFDGQLSASAAPNNWRIWSFKTDFNGTLLWSNVAETGIPIGSSDPYIIRYTENAPDGGVLIVTDKTRMVDGNGYTTWSIPQNTRVFYDGYRSFYYYRFVNTFMPYNNSQMPGYWTSGYIFLDRFALPTPPPPIDLGPDTTLCYERKSIVLGQNLPLGYQYEWKTRSSLISRQRTFSAAYSQRLYLSMSSAFGCTVEDSIIVDFCLESRLRDTANCRPITLYANSPLTPAWSNGSYTITAEQSGLYAVTLTNLRGSSITDTVKVTIYEAAVTGYTDTLHNSIFLNLPVGTPPFQYLWNDGSTTQNREHLARGDYAVTVTDKNGCTASAQFKIPKSVKTDDLSQKTGFRIYPNPTSGLITVEIPEESAFSDITLQNALGQIWHLKSVSAAGKVRQYDLSGFPSGAYWLRSGPVVLPLLIGR